MGSMGYQRSQAAAPKTACYREVEKKLLARRAQPVSIMRCRARCRGFKGGYSTHSTFGRRSWHAPLSEGSARGGALFERRRSGTGSHCRGVQPRRSRTSSSKAAVIKSSQSGPPPGGKGNETRITRECAGYLAGKAAPVRSPRLSSPAALRIPAGASPPRKSCPRKIPGCPAGSWKFRCSS
jgi:hypothetical protein